MNAAVRFVSGAAVPGGVCRGCRLAAGFICAVIVGMAAATLYFRRPEGLLLWNVLFWGAAGVAGVILAVRFRPELELWRAYQWLEIGPDALIFHRGKGELAVSRGELVGYGMVVDPEDPARWSFVFTRRGGGGPSRIYHRAVEEPERAKRLFEAWCAAGTPPENGRCGV